MSYRTVKKAYKRTFGKADYVRNTTTTKVKVEPDNVVYVKTESPINKAITALLMKRLSMSGSQYQQRKLISLVPCQHMMSR